MTRGAKDLKVFFNIIIPVFVNVMHTQNFRTFIIATFFTLFKPIKFKHHSSYCGKFWNKNFFFTFVHTRSTAKLTIFRSTICELFATMKAFIISSSSTFHGILITFLRTIFGFITARRNMSKRISAYQTIGDYFLPIIKTLASIGTELRIIISRRSDIVSFITKETFFNHKGVLCH